MVLRESDTARSREGGIAAVAAGAADAIRQGRAHVEPNFLSGPGLESARADMQGVFAPVTEAEAGGTFESIQTDLMDPAFRQTLPTPLPFSTLLGQLDELRAELADRTGRPLLGGGGLHLMRYPVGTKFARHVDEDAALYEPVRNSISLLVYLTPDDWVAADGGALRVYERGEGATSEPSRELEVLPVAGTLVIYDSELEHEVLPTRRERHLISGRFRELDEHWSSRRDREVRE